MSTSQDQPLADECEPEQGLEHEPRKFPTPVRHESRRWQTVRSGVLPQEAIQEGVAEDAMGIVAVQGSQGCGPAEAGGANRSAAWMSHWARRSRQTSSCRSAGRPECRMETRVEPEGPWRGGSIPWNLRPKVEHASGGGGSGRLQEEASGKMRFFAAYRGSPSHGSSWTGIFPFRSPFDGHLKTGAPQHRFPVRESFIQDAIAIPGRLRQPAPGRGW